MEKDDWSELKGFDKEEGRSKQPWNNKLEFVQEADDDDDELEEGEIREVANKDNIKVCCPECSKEFTSGKALGGHMRIHNIPHKKGLQMIKTVKVGKKTQTNSNKFIEKSDYMSKCKDDNGQPICRICGKNFPSFKSLFGHMRCHPERCWRGIMPPEQHLQSSLVDQTNDSPKSSSSSSSLSTTDDDFPKWTVRAKRGRKVEVSSSSGSQEEKVQIRDAVDDLMMLSRGDRLFDDLGKHQRVDEIEGTNISWDTIKDDSGLKKSEFDERKAAIEVSDELSDNNEMQLMMNSNTPYKMRGKKKKMKLMMELESGLDVTPTKAHQKLDIMGETSPDKYKCSTCNKSFPTHQALGGHRSSHNKFKVIITNTVVADNEEHGGGGGEDNGSNENKVKLVENAKDSGVASGSTTATSTHQCTICNKVFPTGQALGGHKRCHWTGPPAADQAGLPSSLVNSSSPGEASHTALAVAAEEVSRVLEFDLNEEPPMEDEVEGGDNGNGYAVSSSCNSNSNNG